MLDDALEEFSPAARVGFHALVNYMGGAIMFIRRDWGFLKGFVVWKAAKSKSTKSIVQKAWDESIPLEIALSNGIARFPGGDFIHPQYLTHFVSNECFVGPCSCFDNIECSPVFILSRFRQVGAKRPVQPSPPILLWRQLPRSTPGAFGPFSAAGPQ